MSNEKKEMLLEQNLEKIDLFMDKDLLTKNQKKKQETKFDHEMATGKISKGKKKEVAGDLVKPVAISKTKTVIKNYNDKGEKLTKAGTIDKRTGKLDPSSSRYKQLLAGRVKKDAIKVPYVEESSEEEDDEEFTIETIEATPPPPPSQTDIFLQKEIDFRKKMDGEMSKLMEKNKMLEQGLIFNNHLKQIDHLSRQTMLRF